MQRLQSIAAETKEQGVFTKEECDTFFLYLMEMQGNIGARGNSSKDSFWRKAARASGDEASVKTIKTESIAKTAKAHWDELLDYKDANITVFEVEDTFPAIFFLQEIKDNVIDVKINCI